MDLNKIFTSHMVFSAHRPIRIYGEGSGNVRIEFAGDTAEVTAKDGKWFVELPSKEYGGPYTLKAVFEERTVVLDDIYIGEVYLFAGQSNMQFKMSMSNSDLEKYASNDMLRLYSTDRIEKSDRFTSDDGWKICEKDEIGYWSAIAFLTSNEIALRKGVAVGVIVCYQGASVIESWVPEGSFSKIGISIPVEKKHTDHTHEIYGAWNGDGVLYGYALSQVIPFALSAVVWYQGESDTMEDEARVYLDELKALIGIWREAFASPELPFAVVQIADFIPRSDDGWRLIQRAQLEIGTVVENVSTVISSDVCEKDDIHPKTKDVLSHRIADVLLGRLG